MWHQIAKRTKPVVCNCKLYIQMHFQLAVIPIDIIKGYSDGKPFISNVYWRQKKNTTKTV